MARKMTEWPSKRGPITKIMPSDGCIGDTVPLAVGKWYEFHEFGWYMGNVGLNHRSYPNRCSGENRRIDTLGGALRQYVRADAGGNPGRRFVHRISRAMGVAGRRLDLAVTKQLADRRQALAQRQGT